MTDQAEERILVIVPTYNERDNIEPIVTRLRRAVARADVLVVDDNSPDGTGQLADALADRDCQVKVMHRQGKEGLGAAYLAGFRWGLDHGYDVLVEHDADGSHQPEQLPRLLAALADADMVKGSRYVAGGSVVNWPKSRELLSRGGSWWTRLMIGLPLRDITGGFNAFKAETLRAVLDDIASVGYNLQVDLTWQVVQHGFKVVEVPIDFIERQRGQSKMSGRIVVEALLRTTVWGARHRWGQLRNLFRPSRPRA
ncbi:MAG: polyprenol monophosphomannose synthase [Propionibacteriaceae bacterium]|jgi:dolichol-phosphate mannosyltransferase|nr:polyprenol monophosphomannose synthase [Propionibacteriaceae bacterium]